MEKIKQNNDIKFVDRVKMLQSCNDLFDLENIINIIDEDVERDGVYVIETIVEEVIEAIKSTPNDIPQVKTLLEYIIDKYIINLANIDEDLRKSILLLFSAHKINRDQEQIRKISIEILTKYNPRQIITYLIDVARDQTESHLMRKTALQCIEESSAKIDNISLLLEILERNEENYMTTVMNILEKHQKSVDIQKTQSVLEEISRRHTTSVNIRCQAIKLLGIFGDIELLERMCLLSGKEPKILDALQQMLKFLLSKPINILGIRSENFEHLVKELLVKLGYQEVHVTQAVYDGGVDVIAHKEVDGVGKKKHKVIVQCKRYTNKQIDYEIVEKLLHDMGEHQAKEGLLITTSTFSKAAQEFAKKHQYIELIDREKLQSLLDKAFDDNYYCINSSHKN
jgi:restriction endonuclease Mrr